MKPTTMRVSAGRAKGWAGVGRGGQNREKCLLWGGQVQGKGWAGAKKPPQGWLRGWAGIKKGRAKGGVG